MCYQCGWNLLAINIIQINGMLLFSLLSNRSPAVCREDDIEDEEWRARRAEVEKQAQEARLLKKRKRAENEARMRAEVCFAIPFSAIHSSICPTDT